MPPIQILRMVALGCTDDDAKEWTVGAVIATRSECFLLSARRGLPILVLRFLWSSAWNQSLVGIRNRAGHPTANGLSEHGRPQNEKENCNNHEPVRG